MDVLMLKCTEVYCYKSAHYIEMLPNERISIVVSIRQPRPGCLLCPAMKHSHESTPVSVFLSVFLT